MQIFSQARSWVQSRIQAPCDDFKQAPEPPVSSAKTALVSAGIGAGVGGALGGGVAYHSVANDSPYFDWVTEQIPLAGTGPSPTDVFGAELDRFETLVFEQSENSVSGRDTLQYLSYLKYQNPKLPDTELSEIYASLEGQLGRDSQVRSALNMISAHVAKHGSTPSEAYRELRNYFGYETDFGKATDMFLRDQKITDLELNETTVQMVTRHTSPFAHLGMARAVALGVAGGIAIGAVTGAVVGVGVHLLGRLAEY